MKGNSTTHVYSRQGRLNHDNVIWDSTSDRCPHGRTIGKGRVVCIKYTTNDCPVQGKRSKCPYQNKTIRTD